MTLKEIRESGLLELYLIGSLDAEEKRIVENALLEFPELNNDLIQIGNTLESYAKLHGETPSSGLKSKIIQEATGGSYKENPQSIKQPSSANFWPFVTVAMGLLSLLLGYMWMQSKSESELLKESYNQEIQSCDSLRTQLEIEYATLSDLTDPDNRILAVTATPKYATTNLYFHTNPIDQKNYIQIKNLPVIDNNTQSFQLWSIKGNLAPIPLDVFQSDGNTLIAVSHIDATDVYAITIEPRGGSQSPTLDDLIGTFSVSS